MKMEPEHEHHHTSPNNLNNQIRGVRDLDTSDEDDIHNHDHPTNNGVDQVRDLPKSKDSVEKKLCWLRSQIIGASAEFDTPFGRRRLTYADHTASGRSLRYIEDYIITNLLPFYGNSHTSDSHVGQRTTKMVHEAASYVKKCLGGGEGDAVLFCGSGSTAAIKRLQEVMGIAIPSILRERMLNCLSKEERWVVLVGPYEHHSNLNSWRQSLAEVVEIGLDRRGLLDTEALRRNLECYRAENRPILGSFSACSNVTGICTDTRAVARLLHQYGGFACFDFAASGPYAKIDMRSDGYDAIFVSTHKFLGGPGAPGILLMNTKLYQLASSPPSTCGGGTVDFVNGFNEKDTIYVDNIEEREDAGTPPIIQKIRAALAFWVKEYIGYHSIKKLEKSYIGRAMQRLKPNSQICILGNTSAKRLAILSFLIYPSSTTTPIGDAKRGSVERSRDKPLHGPFVAKLLNDLFGIQARGGCACAGPYGHALLNVDEPLSLAFRYVIQKGYTGIKPGWTRVSFPYYMSEDEFELILAAIEFIASYGLRFLSLYHFDWRTGAWTFKNSDNHNIASNTLKGSSLGSMIDGLDLQQKFDGQNRAKTKENVLRKHANYLETAKQIATLLPRTPTSREIPQEIDFDLVPFRV